MDDNESKNIPPDMNTNSCAAEGSNLEKNIEIADVENQNLKK